MNPRNLRRLSQSPAVLEVSKEFWIAEYFPEDADGGELATDGRVIEMLSEHTVVESMLEGYLLTGRHGFISSYEAFVHVIDSMFNQHATWLSISNDLSWREEISSLNLLITSILWRQDQLFLISTATPGWIGAHAEERYRDQHTDCRNYAYEHGIDNPEIVGWRSQD